MKFNTELMQELAMKSAGSVYEDKIYGKIKILKNAIGYTSRWSSHHTLIFQIASTLKFYKSVYSRGLTENQDESPYEFEEEFVKVVEVEPYEVTIVKYREVKK